MSESEVDSLRKAKPFCFSDTKSSLTYEQLVKKGIISNEQLDTTGLNLRELSYQIPTAVIKDIRLKFDSDNQTGQQHLIIQKQQKTIAFDFDAKFLDNRWATVQDNNGDGIEEILTTTFLNFHSYIRGFYIWNIYFFYKNYNYCNWKEGLEL